VLRKLKGVQVVGICDNDWPRRARLAARFETGAAYDDIEDLLELAKVDAVVICTPNHLHEAHAVSALAAVRTSWSSGRSRSPRRARPASSRRRSATSARCWWR